MRARLYRGVALVAALALILPPPTVAQTPPPAAPAPAAPAAATVNAFNTEQLDALLAPIALYPDALLAQVLMAATYPLQIVEASRWLDNPANKALTGDALTQALVGQPWDPSVKSLVPFPQVMATLNSKLDWTQQLGYAFATQPSDVMDSVQRLRQQAQAAGYLKTTEQQTVTVENRTIVIEPANPQVVYVPVYSPTVVYGSWPYPTYPPVYVPPPPGYVVGTAFMTGLAFATGALVVGSLWGWARPTWYGSGAGNVNVNVNRYNNINVNRTQINSSVWRPPAGGAGGAGGRPIRPPGGPVGAPSRPVPLPANAIGRPNVQVPGSAVNRPAAGGNAGQGGGARHPGIPGQGGGTQRPGTPGQGGGAQRPGTPGQGGGAQRPGGGTLPGGGAAQRPGGTPAQRPGGGAAGGAGNRPSAPAQRPSGAFGGINDGARANQFGNRGAQSRAAQPQAGNRGGGGGGGAAQQRQAPQSRGGGGGGGRAGNRGG